MAKKDNDAAYETFLADLKKINPKIEEVLDDATNAKLKDAVLARSEFSKQSDALAADRKEMEAFLTQERDKIAGWQDWYGKTSQEFATATDKLTAYKEAYGELDSKDQRREAAKVGLSPEEFRKQLDETINQHDVAALKFVDELTDLKIEHRDRFKEKLDTDSLYKLAGAKGLPLGAAYNLFVAERVETARKEDMEAQLKKAREEGANEALSRHNLPTVSGDPHHLHVMDVKQPITNASERVAAAAKDFMDNRARGH